MKTTPFPPIADYAVIGDARTAALVSRSGSIEWLCLPHYSAPSLFAAILDRENGGHFRISAEAPLSSSRRYVGHTNVLETTFQTSSGKVRVTDLMPMAPSSTQLQPMREVLRIVEGIEGTVRLQIHVDPRPGYGRQRPALRKSAVTGWTWSWGDELLTLRTEAELTATQGSTTLSGHLSVEAGTRRYFSLCYTKGDIGCIAPLGERAHARFEATLAWWTRWVHQCRYDGPYREAVLRSALTLKLTTYALSGGVVAALTASLPESLGGSDNWDYRYCWLRDAALTMHSYTALGFMDEARSFFAWLLHTTRLTSPYLRVLYDVYGRTNVPEWQIDEWEGYARSRPVRIGNAAVQQLQLDVYGTVLYAALSYVRSDGELDYAEARTLKGFGKAVLELWRCADNGMWEIRGERRQHTSSKVWCWTALDCLRELVARGLIKMNANDLAAGCSEIANLIERRAYNDSLSSYVNVLDGDAVDSSLLLMACLGYTGADEPRMCSTYDLIQQRLNRNGLLYRYESDVGQNGTFGICSFWAVDYLVCRGDIDEARCRFEHALSFANDVGLFAEEIAPDDGRFLGNFPQIFTHVGLIFAALSLADPEARRRSHRRQ